MGLFQRKAPSAVYELNDEQVARWREGDRSAWNEDAKGRPLSARAIARRDREATRTPAELAARMGRPAPRADIEWEAEAG